MDRTFEIPELGGSLRKYRLPVGNGCSSAAALPSGEASPEQADALGELAAPYECNPRMNWR
jgi:hypothetical protein